MRAGRRRSACITDRRQRGSCDRDSGDHAARSGVARASFRDRAAGMTLEPCRLDARAPAAVTLAGRRGTGVRSARRAASRDRASHRGARQPGCRFANAFYRRPSLSSADRRRLGLSSSTRWDAATAQAGPWMRAAARRHDGESANGRRRHALLRRARQAMAALVHAGLSCWTASATVCRARSLRDKHGSSRAYPRSIECVQL